MRPVCKDCGIPCLVHSIVNSLERRNEVTAFVQKE